MFEHAAKLNWEGIFSKKPDAPYKSERWEAWQKVKTVQRAKFPVVGFVKDPSGVAALYLGKHEGEELVYMGKVDTGWNRTTSSKIRKALETVVSPKAKLTQRCDEPKQSDRHCQPRSGAQLRQLRSPPPRRAGIRLRGDLPSPQPATAAGNPDPRAGTRTRDRPSARPDPTQSVSGRSVEMSVTGSAHLLDVEVNLACKFELPATTVDGGSYGKANYFPFSNRTALSYFERVRARTGIRATVTT